MKAVLQLLTLYWQGWDTISEGTAVPEDDASQLQPDLGAVEGFTPLHNFGSQK